MSDADLRKQSRYTWMLVAFSALVIFLMAQQSRADINWDGDGSQGNFSWSENWYGNTQPTWGFSSGNLVFNYKNGSQTSLYYDYGNWRSINDIFWASTFGAGFTLSASAGSGINFNQRIQNDSSYGQTVAMSLSGGKNGAAQIELNPVNGDLTLTGNLYNDNNLSYKTYGGNSKLLTIGITLGGGSSVSYAIEQYSKVYITAAQAIGGSSTFDVKTGELWIGTGGSLTNGMRINLGLNDANTAKFYLTGTASDSHNITVANNGGIKVIGTLGSGGATNTFSGNITNNATSGGVLLENVTNGVANFTGVISGTGSVQVGGGSTAGTVILAASNTLSGPLYVSAGTLSITNANSLGTGQIQFGNAGTSLSLLVNSNTTITNQFRINNAASNGAINVASGSTTTISGQLTQDSSKTNSTKFGKDGAGTLILNNGTSDFNGRIQIGNGTVILGATAALGTNGTTAARGVDLGLNVGDTSLSNNVSLLASNGVTVGQSIYVAPNTSSGTRTIGLSGSGTNTFNNEIYLNGNLTVDAGTAASDRVNLSGALVNTGGVIKNGAGTASLSGSSANTYSGSTTINTGTLKLEKSGVNAISGTIAVNGGTLLLGAANQIADGSAVTLAGGTLNTAGYADAVGKLTVSANSTIQGLNSASGSAFTFSDIDLGSYSTSSGSTLTFLNSSGTSYALGTVIQLSSVAASSWTGYSTTSINNFSSKISFSDANLMAQINFGGGTSGTTLTVAAIPEPKVYVAAGALAFLIGYAEVRRRRKSFSSKA